jgi:hypothetical protein
LGSQGFELLLEGLESIVELAAGCGECGQIRYLVSQRVYLDLHHPKNRRRLVDGPGQFFHATAQVVDALR